MFHSDSGEMMIENVRAGNREFLDKIIKNYQQICMENRIAESTSQLKLYSTKFENVDFRGLSSDDLDIFDFTDCDITGSYLDRSSLEGFKKYIQNNQIKFSNMFVEDCDLSPIIIDNPKHSIRYLYNCNLDGLDLSNVSFQNSNLSQVSFTNTNISGCNFLHASNISPKMFAKSLNFNKAKFMDDFQEDHDFKEKISAYANIYHNITEKPYKARSYPIMSGMLEPIDTVRLDDPNYSKIK